MKSSPFMIRPITTSRVRTRPSSSPRYPRWSPTWDCHTRGTRSPRTSAAACRGSSASPRHSSVRFRGVPWGPKIVAQTQSTLLSIESNHVWVRYSSHSPYLQVGPRLWCSTSRQRAWTRTPGAPSGICWPSTRRAGRQFNWQFGLKEIIWKVGSLKQILGHYLGFLGTSQTGNAALEKVARLHHWSPFECVMQHFWKKYTLLKCDILDDIKVLSLNELKTGWDPRQRTRGSVSCSATRRGRRRLSTMTS